MATPTEPADPWRSRLSTRSRSQRSSAVRDLLRLVDRPEILSLAGGLPAGELFPVERLAGAAVDALEAAGPLGRRALQYGATDGEAEFLDWISARDGRPGTSSLVTTGSQQALDLVARVLIDPGDVVVAERPGYLGALQVFSSAGARVEGIEVDHDGLRTDLLGEALGAGLRPKLVYVVPEFQNPTGVVLAEARRVELLSLAERYGFLVVEDDPYGQLRFRGEVSTALGPRHDHVLRLSSSSKVLAPGLRVGWCTGPSVVVQAMVVAKQATDLHTSTWCQRIVLECLSDETFMAAHLDSLRAVYSAREQALREALSGHLDVRPVDGGLFSWVDLGSGVDATAVLTAAIERGVAFVPGEAFDASGASNSCARLSFASLTPEQLVEAARRLVAALESSAP
ncbi:MAG: PLP-dependent aminotransferase family protein [Ilumatobacteraceae bacterium]